MGVERRKEKKDTLGFLALKILCKIMASPLGKSQSHPLFWDGKKKKTKEKKKKKKEKSAKKKKSIHLQHHVQRNKVAEGEAYQAGVLGLGHGMGGLGRAS